MAINQQLKRVVFCYLFFASSMIAYGQKNDCYVVVQNKKYFTCYMNPFHAILNDVSAWNQAIKNYNDTVNCQKIKINKWHNSLKISIELRDGDKITEVFKRLKGSSLYKSKSYSKIHHALSCSMFIYDYYFSIENRKAVVWFKDNEGVDQSVISLNW